jgi:Tfp pilus assembly protein PilN
VRPINLIPEEQRRSGSGGVSRTGPVAYVLVGILAVALIGVVMLVLFSNQVHDSEAEVARLETEKTAATARATKLSAYTNFKQVSEDRTRTVAELADARFDWVRVIRQLSLVLPGDVYFERLIASAGGSGESSGVGAPSLALIGCADGQPSVAGFVAALRGIDGVTRVELGNSTLNEKVGGGDGGGDPCARPGVAQFKMLVAFDGAPVSPDSAESTIGKSVEGEEEGSESEGSSESEGTEGEGGEEEGSSSEGSESSTSQSASTATAGATG